MNLTRRAFIATVVTGMVVKASNPTGIVGGFNYQPHPAQVAFMNSPENLMFTYGGYRGGGKTWTMHRKALEVMKEFRS